MALSPVALSRKISLFQNMLSRGHKGWFTWIKNNINDSCHFWKHSMIAQKDFTTSFCYFLTWEVFLPNSELYNLIFNTNSGTGLSVEGISKKCLVFRNAHVQGFVSELIPWSWIFHNRGIFSGALKLKPVKTEASWADTFSSPHSSSTFVA